MIGEMYIKIIDECVNKCIVRKHVIITKFLQFYEIAFFVILFWLTLPMLI